MTFNPIVDVLGRRISNFRFTSLVPLLTPAAARHGAAQIPRYGAVAACYNSHETFSWHECRTTQSDRFQAPSGFRACNRKQPRWDRRLRYDVQGGGVESRDG